MWLAFLKFLGGPAIAGLISAYQAKLAAENTDAKTAADLAARELAVEQRERELAVKQNHQDEGRWWTAAPRAVATWSFAIYIAAKVVGEGVLHIIKPDLLTGDMATWAGWLMALWFGGRSAEKVARILRK